MMNPGNELSPSVSEPQTRLIRRVMSYSSERASSSLRPEDLKPEDIKKFEECSTGLYFKVGLPYAIFYEVMASYFSKKPAVEETMQKVLLKRGFRFFGNMFLGRLLAAPMCYSEMMIQRAELLKKTGALEEQHITKLERTQPLIQGKDSNYFANPVRNFRDLEGSFSSDYDTSKLLPDDLEDIKTPKTTYQDLRAQHRRNKEPLLSVRTEPKELETYSPPIENPFSDESPPPPPQRIIRKNKYGDEIE